MQSREFSFLFRQCFFKGGYDKKLLSFFKYIFVYIISDEYKNIKNEEK